MEQLKLLGSDGLLVNVGRATALVQGDTYHALKERIITGAALEVWWGRNKDADEKTGRRDPYQFPFHDLDIL